MSALQTFMLAVDHNKEEAKQIAERVAQDVENRKTKLIEVVQSLSEYINDEDLILRGKAVSYLTAVIKALPPKYLSRQQIQVLTTFFCDRIEDGGAVAGLDTLQRLDRFNSQLAEEVAQAIFGRFQDLQSRSQSQRFQVYQLLNELMSSHRAALHEMGDVSLVGIVDLMTGEKDPRNLMLVFSILKVVMVEWDISNHAELLFESVYNYFPITFRPPPNDPYGITAQDLKDRLQDCISATSLFAPYAIPALLDKLDSTSQNVKKDALNALIACIQSYDPNTVSKHSITIWDVLKFEILNAQEEFLSELSLQALSGIAKRLSEGVIAVSEQSPLAQFLRPITKECNDQLREPQQKQAKPAQQILRSTSAASIASFTVVVQTVVAPLLTIYQEADGIAKQRALLETLGVLFDSAIKVFGEWTSKGPEPGADNALSEFKDQFSDIFGQALMGAAHEEVSFRVTALKGFLRLSVLRSYFQDNEIGLFVQYLDEILLKEESVGRGELKAEAIKALAEISKHKPRLIMDITFPAFVATLPDSEDGSNAEYLTTLENLAQISVEKDIFETLVRRLLSKLTILLHREQPGSAAYPRAILITILYVMQQRDMENDPNLDLYYDKIVVGLCRGVADAATGGSKNRTLNDATVIETLGRLCNLIVRCLPKEKQEEVAKNVYTLFAASNDFAPVPFSQSPSADQLRTMIISTYLLAGLSKDCSDIPYTKPDMSSLLSDIVNRSVTESEPATQLALLRHSALLVNKFLPKSELSIATAALEKLLSTGAEEKSLTTGTIKTIFWLSKAMILRLAPTTSQILTSLLSLLSSPDEATSTTAARGFAILLKDDDVLSLANGANIRLLAKQRVFTTLTPLISARIREVNVASDASSTPAHIKPAHLTALSGILSTISPSLVMPELPTLLPLLLQSLDLQTADSQAVRAATLETLAVIIRENGVGVIEECGHVQSLVTRLLKTAVYSPAAPDQAGPVNGPRLRAETLKCLYLLAQTPSSDAPAVARAGKLSPLLPVKNQVVRSLGFVLDDPKRDVRKAAVDARGAWLRNVDDALDEED
ncbi:MET18/MMS19 family protein [Aspergillus clavatus NRRL 1]|uniref:MMS19 nucleotide excision repair protein n=1 Tax=Aspergillus clavatus (strain ATCC 1007 / CBS 513.65 / DSM 816 / NCTC 3887 / NRRL 1 / QM 1276 / 107) TaxID=344612 RepID=A1C478_ASPCL|nr:DNA repair/transcription protein, putative [Aspergillus clavatus NRRL 1]EAW15218.1 DNA repair/transcription protein, putative [Aspergillus clavatus NRRL 1]